MSFEARLAGLATRTRVSLATEATSRNILGLIVVGNGDGIASFKVMQLAVRQLESLRVCLKGLFVYQR